MTSLLLVLYSFKKSGKRMKHFLDILYKFKNGKRNPEPIFNLTSFQRRGQEIVNADLETL